MGGLLHRRCGVDGTRAVLRGGCTGGIWTETG